MNDRARKTGAHVCHEYHGCTCSSYALEPSEGCFDHGGGPWPPKCDVCGRFLRWDIRERFSATEA